MKLVAIIGIVAFLLIFISEYTQDKETAEPSDLRSCKVDSDCVIVPHDHCCGSTKKAINIKYLEEYNDHPEWQSFHGPECAYIGVCISDKDITKAMCEQGTCYLRIPLAEQDAIDLAEQNEEVISYREFINNSVERTINRLEDSWYLRYTCKEDSPDALCVTGVSATVYDNKTVEISNLVY